MARLLQMSPIHQGTEIICARSEALGLAEKANATRPVPTEDVRAVRRNVLDQLESVRSRFWTMPIDELNNQLQALDSRGFVDLEAAIARLRVVAAHRDRFPAFSQRPGFDGDFFSALKEVLVRSSRDTAVLREQILSIFRNRLRRKRSRLMVALLKTEMPAIYELEADWFDILYQQKAPPRVTLVTSSNARTGTQTAGSKSDAGSYKWFIWLAIVATSCLLRSVSHDTGSSRTSDRPANSPYIPVVQNYDFKPLPPSIPRNGEVESPNVGEPKGRPFFEGDNHVWEPYSTPYSPESPQRPNSPQSFGGHDPFGPANIFNPSGPGS
jgi:hypothetical protein